MWDEDVRNRIVVPEQVTLGEAIVREEDPICARQLDLAVRLRSAHDHASSADAVLGVSTGKVACKVEALALVAWGKLMIHFSFRHA